MVKDEGLLDLIREAPAAHKALGDPELPIVMRINPSDKEQVEAAIEILKSFLKG